jgi:hypothetical protein
VPVLLLMLAGAWWWRMGGGAALLAGEEQIAQDGVIVDAGPVRVEALPAASANPSPAAFDSHVDADAIMLADPDLGVARDADFYAWFAAGGPIPVDESQSQPTRPAPATIELETVDGDE